MTMKQRAPSPRRLAGSILALCIAVLDLLLLISSRRTFNFPPFVMCLILLAYRALASLFGERYWYLGLCVIYFLLGNFFVYKAVDRWGQCCAAARPGDRRGGACGGGRGQPRCYRVPGQPLLNRHQVGGVSRSPDGLFAQQEWGPIRGRPAVRGKRTYGGRPGQRVEQQGTWASGTQKHSEAGYRQPVDRGVWTAKTVKRPWQQPAHPQYANYWVLLTCKRHTIATFSTAPTHQLLGSANAETTPARAPADRTQRPGATCEGKNG